MTIIGVVFMPFLHELFHPLFHGVLKLEVESIHLPEFIATTFLSPLILLTVVIIILGLYPSYLLYITYKIDYKSLTERFTLLRVLWKFLYERWFINTLYYKIFVDGFLFISRGIFKYIECNGSGSFLKNLYTDFSDAVRRIQTGYFRVNIIYILIGFLILIIITLMLGGAI